MTVAVVRSQDGSLEVVELAQDVSNVIADPFAFLSMPDMGFAVMPGVWGVVVPSHCVEVTA